MKKSELLNWRHEEYQKWEEFLDQINPMHMDQPGVNGDWSMKAIAAHLTDWHPLMTLPNVGRRNSRFKLREAVRNNSGESLVIHL